MIDFKTKQLSAPNPFSLRNKIATNVFEKSAEASIPRKIVATVIDAFERPNICKIAYMDNGIKTVNDAIVSLCESFENSFPKPGSKVFIELHDKKPVIVRKYIEDAEELYANKKITTDNSPDGELSVSYYILPCGGID